MNRKVSLLAGMLFLPLIAAIAGYLAGYTPRKFPEKPDQEASSASPRSIPRLILAKRHLALDPEDEKAGLAFSPHKLDSLLIRCSRMTTPEQLDDLTEQLKKTNPSREQFKIVSSYLSYKWGQIAPRQALDKIKTQGVRSRLSANMIFQGWAEIHPEEAVAYWEELGDSPQYELADDITFYEIMGTEAAAPSYKEERAQQQKDERLKIIAEAMGRASPNRALEWLTGLTGNERQVALRSLLSGIADTHPGQLAKTVEQLSPEEKDDLLYGDIAAQWAARDWEEARKWIDTLPPGGQKERAYHYAFGTLGTLDPEKAAAEFKKLDAHNQMDTASSIADSIAATDPVKSLEWLIDNTSEEIASQCIFSTINSLIDSSAQIHEYILHMPDGKLKQQALYALINKEDPPPGPFENGSNTTLANTAEIKQKKEDDYVSRILQWRRLAPEKAEKWLNTSKLPEKIKQRLWTPSQKTDKERMPL